jgi:hypothetical protein
VPRDVPNAGLRDVEASGPRQRVVVLPQITALGGHRPGCRTSVGGCRAGSVSSSSSSVWIGASGGVRPGLAARERLDGAVLDRAGSLGQRRRARAGWAHDHPSTPHHQPRRCSERVHDRARAHRLGSAADRIGTRDGPRHGLALPAAARRLAPATGAARGRPAVRVALPRRSAANGQPANGRCAPTLSSGTGAVAKTPVGTEYEHVPRASAPGCVPATSRSGRQASSGQDGGLRFDPPRPGLVTNCGQRNRSVAVPAMRRASLRDRRQSGGG